MQPAAAADDLGASQDPPLNGVRWQVTTLSTLKTDLGSIHQNLYLSQKSIKKNN